MGCGESRERTPVVDGAHDTENFCFRAECGIRLHSIEFRDFQAAIKRFGYRINMTTEHMRHIAFEIHLDVDRMLGDSFSPYAVAYLDKDFSFTGGCHNVDNLILLGWLLCKHWSDETQNYELWHIVNPHLAPHVTKREVLSVITRLAYIAVNLNLKMIKNLPGSQGKDEAL